MTILQRLWLASINVASYESFQDPATGEWWHWVPVYEDGATFKKFVQGQFNF